jgi:hypothetical protein
MSILDWRTVAPEQVDPDRLALLLTRNGWVSQGGRAGMYTRWVYEGDPDLSHRVLVPLDRQRADYNDLIREALAELASMTSEHGSQVERILNSLIEAPGDEIKFRKVMATVRGAIAWPTGEELVVSSRNALLAAAKSQVTKMPYYGNHTGRFAHRYLQSVLMGQTEVGSYVVVAFTPVNDLFYEKEPKEGVPPLPNIGAHSGRDITHSLVNALEATQEAVEHFRASASLAGFDDAVQRGVSKEFAEAVKGMVQDAEGAEVAIEWAPESPSLDLQPKEAPVPERTAFEFSADIQPVLERAINRLASMTPSERVRATGWVNVVERPGRGEPGVVRLKVLAGSEARTLRVRLSEEQFGVALEAIRAERVLSVSGRQEREGRTYWLYDAGDLETIEVEPPSTVKSRERSPSRDQLELSSGRASGQ